MLLAGGSALILGVPFLLIGLVYVGYLSDWALAMRQWHMRINVIA
jgi:hypothetical protein